ncbi:MAG TPA: hypothetical protein V6D14_22715 [Coleofasciculaceae cyanobacterium]
METAIRISNRRVNVPIIHLLNQLQQLDLIFTIVSLPETDEKAPKRGGGGHIEP